MVDILHISPEQLLEDSFRLGQRVYESGFRPKHAVSIWRGGTPIGLGVDAYFKSQGLTIHHTSIATSSYQGIDQQTDVVVKGLEHVIGSVCREDKLLLIDDVYESGRTIEKIVSTIRERARRNAPENIMVATIHKKLDPNAYGGLPVISLHDVEKHVWIDYPHELGDLVEPEEPTDQLILRKSPDMHEILHGGPAGPFDVETTEPVTYVSPRDMLRDSVQLGVNIANDDFCPDFLVAIWPGGVLTGLYIHEVFQYYSKRHGKEFRPDHIPLNTTQTHLSYRTNIIGLEYLVERVEHHHNVLLVDTIFRSGRVMSDVVGVLKEGLRRNLDLDRVRIATVYWNPKDDTTWSGRPFKKRPDYYLKKVDNTLVYPHAPHRFRNPRRDVRKHNFVLADILYPRD